MAFSFLLQAIIIHAQTIPYWTKLATFPNAGVTDVFFLDTLHGIVAVDTGTSGGAIIYYTSNQITWQQSANPSVVEVNAIRLIHGKLYAAVKGPDILVSTDSGATWNFSGMGLANASDVYSDGSGNIRVLSGFPMFSRATFARVDNFYCLASGDGGAFLSGDGGATWYPITIGSYAPGFSNYGDTCSHIFVYHNLTGDVYTSSDHGATWQPAGPSFEPSNGEGISENILEGGSGSRQRCV